MLAGMHECFTESPAIFLGTDQPTDHGRFDKLWSCPDDRYNAYHIYSLNTIVFATRYESSDILRPHGELKFDWDNISKHTSTLYFQFSFKRIIIFLKDMEGIITFLIINTNAIQRTILARVAMANP